MQINPQNFNQIIAFDVSKAHLDYHIAPASLSGRLVNKPAAIERFLIRLRKKYGANTLIVCEATGGYERPLLLQATAAGLSAHRAEGRRIRLFARSVGKYAKTDALDAAVIALYALKAGQLRRHEELSEEEQSLKALQRRREELMRLLHGEKCRAATEPNRVVKASLRQVIAVLEKQMKAITTAIQRLIAATNALARKARLMQSLKGVGPVTSLTLLAHMPELGQLSKGEAAALAGLAPYNRDSGKTNMPRHIHGGRAAIRRGMFMAALVAVRHNPLLRRKYDALMARGKPCKLALTAIMRKMIVILNGILKSEQPWKGAQTA